MVCLPMRQTSKHFGGNKMLNFLIEKLENLGLGKFSIMCLAAFSFAWLAPFGVGDMPQAGAALIAAGLIFLLLD